MYVAIYFAYNPVMEQAGYKQNKIYLRSIRFKIQMKNRVSQRYTFTASHLKK